MGKIDIWNEQSFSKLEQYVERHYQHLERIVKAVEETKETEQFARRKGAVPLDGTGAGVAVLPVPLGYDWVLQRVTITSTGNGSCTFYENVQANSEVLEIIGSSQLYSDAFSNSIYVPSGSSVLIAFANAGVNGQGTYNLQIKLLKHSAHTHQPKAAMI